MLCFRAKGWGSGSSGQLGYGNTDNQDDGGDLDDITLYLPGGTYFTLFSAFNLFVFVPIPIC